MSILQESFAANLLRLIQKMKPQSKGKVKKKKKKKKAEAGEDWEGKVDSEDVELKKKQFPALALKDDDKVRVCL